MKIVRVVRVLSIMELTYVNRIFEMDFMTDARVKMIRNNLNGDHDAVSSE